MFEPLMWGAAIALGFDMFFIPVGDKKHIRQGMKASEADKATKKLALTGSLAGVAGTFISASLIGINSFMVNVGMLIGGVITAPSALYLMFKLRKRWE